eukprot:1158359-Pelagomonas_calceolata.AAC.3
MEHHTQRALKFRAQGQISGCARLGKLLHNYELLCASVLVAREGTLSRCALSAPLMYRVPPAPFNKYHGEMHSSRTL